ncbi:unnamed protein product, partial [Brenthis ino]
MLFKENLSDFSQGNKSVLNMFTRRTSSDESEISESLVNMKSAFRVSVCLQRYFKDVRSRCYLLVTRNRPVRWLEKRIQKVFTLPGNFCLITNGHMLPSSEPLALLNPDDFIEVIPLPEVNESAHNRDSEKNKYNVDPHSKSYSQYKTDLSGKWNTCSENFTSDNKLQNIEANGEHTLKAISEDHIDSVETSKAIAGKNTTVNVTGAESLNNIEEADDSTQSLWNLKRKALAILDSKISTDKDERETEEGSCDPPRRTRRRVRHRRRRAAEPEQDSTEHMEYESFSLQEQQVLPINTPISVPGLVESLSAVDAKPRLQEPILPKVSGSSKEPERDAVVSQLLLQEVTRNETTHSRKPRVVHSLNE